MPIMGGCEGEGVEVGRWGKKKKYQLGKKGVVGEKRGSTITISTKANLSF